MGLRQWILIISKNSKEWGSAVKHRWYLLFVPIAITLFLYFFMEVKEVENQFFQPIRVGVSVEDESPFATMLVKDFESKKDLNRFFIIERGETRSITEKFEKQELDAIVIVPAGFVQSLMHFGDTPMHIQLQAKDPAKRMILDYVFSGYEEYIRSVETSITAFYNTLYSQVDPDSFWEYNDALSIELITHVFTRQDYYSFETIQNIPTVLSLTYYYAAISVILCFFMGLITAMVLIKERHQGVFRRLRLTGISIGDYLIGSWISYVGLTFIGFFIWTSIMSLFFEDGFFINSWKLLGYVCLMVGFSISMGLFLSALFESETNLMLFGGVLGFLTALLGGSLIPLPLMPISMQHLARLTPNYHSIRHLIFLHLDIYEGSPRGLFAAMLGCIIVLNVGAMIIIKRKEASQ